MGGSFAPAVPRPWGATRRSNASIWANRSTCRCDLMRPLFLLLFGAVSALAQPFSFGVKAGVPLNDFLNAAQSQHFAFNTTTNRYIVGPTAELHLPFGLGVEFDILYRHFDYNGSGTLAGVVTNSGTTGNAWEFPLLAKYRLPMKVVHPYVDAGV